MLVPSINRSANLLLHLANKKTNLCLWFLIATQSFFSQTFVTPLCDKRLFSLWPLCRCNTCHLEIFVHEIILLYLQHLTSKNTIKLFIKLFAFHQTILTEPAIFEILKVTNLKSLIIAFDICNDKCLSNWPIVMCSISFSIL